MDDLMIGNKRVYDRVMDKLRRVWHIPRLDCWGIFFLMLFAKLKNHCKIGNCCWHCKWNMILWLWSKQVSQQIEQSRTAEASTVAKPPRKEILWQTHDLTNYGNFSAIVTLLSLQTMGEHAPYTDTTSVTVRSFLWNLKAGIRFLSTTTKNDLGKSLLTDMKLAIMLVKIKWLDGEMKWKSHWKRRE